MLNTYVPGNKSSNLLPLHMEAFGNSQTDIPILYWNVRSNRFPLRTSPSCMINKPTHSEIQWNMSNWRIHSNSSEIMKKAFYLLNTSGVPVGDDDVCFSVSWILIAFSEDLSIHLFNLRPLKNIHAQCNQQTVTHCHDDCIHIFLQQIILK